MQLDELSVFLPIISFVKGNHNREPKLEDIKYNCYDRRGVENSSFCPPLSFLFLTFSLALQSHHSFLNIEETLHNREFNFLYLFNDLKFSNNFLIFKTTQSFSLSLFFFLTLSSHSLSFSLFLSFSYITIFQWEFGITNRVSSFNQLKPGLSTVLPATRILWPYC